MRRLITALFITLTSAINVIAADPSAPTTVGCTLSPITGPSTVCEGFPVDLYSSGTGLTGASITPDWTSNGNVSFDFTDDAFATYIPNAVDAANGTVTITVANTDPGCSNVHTKVLTIIPRPTVTIIPSATVICETTPLGLVANYTGATGVVWNGGGGTYSPSNNLSSVTYTPTASEISAGYMMIMVTTTGTGVCTPVTGNTLVSIAKSATVDAGASLVGCAMPNNININGTASFAQPGTISWSGGSNVFTNNTSLNTDYVPNGADFTSGSVTLTLTVGSAAPCAPVTDNMVITFQNPVIADAGLDRYLCTSNAGPLQLTATTNGINPTWSGGGGTFSNPNTLMPTYTPNVSELVDQSVISLILTVSAPLPCPAMSTNLLIFVDAPPTVMAGGDQAVCSNSNVDLYPSIMGTANSLTWTTSGTGTFFDPSKANTFYTFSPSDIAAGSVVLTLTDTPPACPAVSNFMTVTIQDAGITVDAGPDQTICANSLTTPVQLAGIVNPASDPNIFWSVVTGSSGITLDDPYTANSIATITDPSFSYFELQLQAGDSDAGCGVVMDNMFIYVFQAPVAVFPNEPICANHFFDLSAINTNAIVWGTTDGTGVFTPNTNSIDVDYTPSTADLVRGSVTFSAQMTGAPGCPIQNITAANPSVIHPLPVVNAGSDVFVCAPSALVLTGSPLRTGSDIESWASLVPTTINDVNGIATVITDGSNINTQYFYSYAKAYSYSGQTGSGEIYCVASDEVNVLYLDHPETQQDALSVPSGILKTMNVTANDNVFGKTYTTTLLTSGLYPTENLVTMTPAGVLTYKNLTSFTTGSDTIYYKVDVCTVSQTNAIIVGLTNGPPIVPDTAIISTSTTVAPNLVVSVDFATMLYDYNNNIDWSTISVISSLSGVTPYYSGSSVVQFQYSSPRAAVFTGRDEIVFVIKDSFDDSLIARYYINISPDYNNPTVKPDDFVVINAISANGDGVNDFMYVYGLSAYHNTVVIYNRWNQKVWEEENYDNNLVKFEGTGNQSGIDGPLPEGSYFYVIKNDGKDENGEKAGLYSGYIELRR